MTPRTKRFVPLLLEVMFAGKKRRGGGTRNRTVKTYNLEFVLPKLLFLGLVEERKISNMVDENETKNGEFRLLRRDLTTLRTKWRAESLKSGWRVELVDFPFRLLGNKLALEVCWEN